MASPQVECPRCGIRRYVHSGRESVLCRDCREVDAAKSAQPLHGEWVTTTAGVRRHIPGPPSRCGTVTGYNKHLRNGERACPECADASRNYARARRGIVTIQALKPHGTHAAYMRHYSARTTPCDACVDAERKYQREAKRRRRAELRAEKKVA